MALEADELIKSIEETFEKINSDPNLLAVQGISDYLATEQAPSTDADYVDRKFHQFFRESYNTKKLTHIPVRLTEMVDLRGVQTFKSGYGLIDFPGAKRADKHALDPTKLGVSILIADFISDKQGLIKAYYSEIQIGQTAIHFVPLVMGSNDAMRLLRVSFRQLDLPESKLIELLNYYRNIIVKSDDRAVTSLYERWIVPSLISD